MTEVKAIFSPLQDLPLPAKGEALPKMSFPEKEKDKSLSRKSKGSQRCSSSHRQPLMACFSPAKASADFPGSGVVPNKETFSASVIFPQNSQINSLQERVEWLENRWKSQEKNHGELLDDVEALRLRMFSYVSKKELGLSEDRLRSLLESRVLQVGKDTACHVAELKRQVLQEKREREDALALLNRQIDTSTENKLTFQLLDKQNKATSTVVDQLNKQYQTLLKENGELKQELITLKQKYQNIMKDKTLKKYMGRKIFPKSEVFNECKVLKTECESPLKKSLMELDNLKSHILGLNETKFQNSIYTHSNTMNKREKFGNIQLMESDFEEIQNIQHLLSESASESETKLPEKVRINDELDDFPFITDESDKEVPVSVSETIQGVEEEMNESFYSAHGDDYFADINEE